MAKRKKLTVEEKKMVKEIENKIPELSAKDKKRWEKYVKKFPVRYDRSTIELFSKFDKLLNKKAGQIFPETFEMYETGMKYIDIIEKEKNTSKKNSALPQTFKELFKDDKTYLRVHNLLISENLIDKESNKWKGNKIQFVQLVRTLLNQEIKVVKGEIKNMAECIKIIAKKSFDIEISDRTVKKVKTLPDYLEKNIKIALVQS